MMEVRNGLITLMDLFAAAAKSLQSCPILCNPIDGSPSESEAAQSCPTLSDPMDCSLPGSSVHGIFQPRVLEWGAIAFSGLQNDRPIS